MELLQSSVPLYYQLKSYIKQKIDSGEWAADSVIPSERELQRLLGLSRSPVRQALGELVSEGLLVRKHGKGTFVTRRQAVPTTTRLVGLVEQLHRQGLAPITEVVEFAACGAPPDAVDSLGIAPGTSMLRAVRRVSVDGACVLADENYFNINLSPVLTPEELAETTVFELLERNGVHVQKGAQRYGALIADERIARLLDVETGTAVLLIRTLLFNNRNQPLQYSLSYCHPDRYAHEILLSR
ncbi:GntR family transcriptional regulator [Paenibacillus lutrae]|nr:GntR family transcriptional regulator [Paenibacillus lutrae]